MYKTTFKLEYKNYKNNLKICTNRLRTHVRKVVNYISIIFTNTFKFQPYSTTSALVTQNCQFIFRKYHLYFRTVNRIYENISSTSEHFN